MDTEKLIDYVRKHEVLYDLNNPHHMNSVCRDKKWAEIATILDQPVATCKARWSNIRDNFRKNLKKRTSKSGQIIRKYKYEDQLEFLIPFIKEIGTKINSTSTESGEENDEPEEDQDIPSDMEYENGTFNQVIDDGVTNSSSSSISLSSFNIDKKLKEEINKSKSTVTEITSTFLLKYMMEKCDEEQQKQQPVHPVDAFLTSIAPTLKSFDPYRLNVAKSKIFNAVQEIEMNHIMSLQQKYENPLETTFSLCNPTPTLSTSTSNGFLH